MGDGETQGVYVHDRICHGFDTGRQGSWLSGTRETE
jgi:hypothetical protein